MCRSVHLCIGDPALVHAIRDLLMDDVDLTGTSARPAAAVVALRDADADMLLVDVDLIADVQRELTSLLARDGDDSERGVILVGATSVHLDVMRAALTAGARGVLPAVLTEADLRAALHTVHRGHVWLSRMSVAALVDQPSTDVRVNMDAFAIRHRRQTCAANEQYYSANPAGSSPWGENWADRISSLAR